MMNAKDILNEKRGEIEEGLTGTVTFISQYDIDKIEEYIKQLEDENKRFLDYAEELELKIENLEEQIELERGYTS